MKITTLSLLCAGMLALGACSSNSGKTEDANTAGGNAGDNYMNSATNGDTSAASMPAGADTSKASAMNSSTAPADMNANMAPMTDAEFMMKADEGGHNEIGLSKLALSKGVTGEAKTYADKMIADHTKAGAELKPIAQKKNVKLSGDMDAEHKTIRDNMTKLSGKEFEKAYMDQMVTDHVKTVALFQSEIKNGKDADAKAFASKTLPVIQQHTDMAKKDSNMKM
ncbi:DUF4142 domain-containing protein [Hymenobacter jejuensis]|uniref:DUF4142 domain-containing protein n=1 Tax=Hymenobacter jejuensis TaxID=2502781 RepID=A0A5B7ZZI1_9BACT|nr:DUF4142 domain-containing protein [Hymenobacter jejuensis]QDA59926.1 DUF4142 domain-containing protein [Hymenobacter jejuensis]